MFYFLFKKGWIYMDGIILYLNAIDIPAWIIKGGKLVFINEILGNDFQTNIEELNNIKKVVTEIVQ